MPQKHTLFLFSLALLGLLAFTGCQLQEGPGGAASITGSVYAFDYNSELTAFRGEGFEGKEDVFIVYGDDDYFGDDIETHYDGTFRFDFLRKGTYTVYVYSKDSTLSDPALRYPIMRTVEITQKGQEINVGTLNIIK